MDKEQQKAAQARESALKNALGQIERQFGQGSIMKMGDEGAQVRVDAIPTGALSLDLALGVGGLPRGRIVEVFGPESSGKTTLVYHVLASAQKLGGICAFIDAEHAMDPAYAKRIGVDIDELLVSQPDHGEQALEIADLLIRSGAVDVVAIDSVAALTPKAELEGAMGDQTVGVQARMMSQAMRKLAGNLNRANTLCVFTNQGERHAFEIEEGDEVLVAAKRYDVREDQLKLILGSLLGDGSLRYTSEGNVSFRVGHGLKQREYCEWKHQMLAPFGYAIGRTGKGLGFDTIPMNQLAWLHEAVYATEGGRTVSDELIEQLDERSIAAWYCDDGSFSGHYKRWGHGKSVIYCKALGAEDKERLAVRCEQLGMGRPTVRDRELLFTGERTRMFQERVAPYVHPSLDYKLHPDMRGRFGWHPDTSDAHLNGTRLKSRTSLRAVPMKGLRKYPTRPSRSRIGHRFDLQIEDNHSYIAGGVVVHNSPETQPGGRAPKFYASQRLDIRRIETLKEGTEAVGNRVRVKVVKNKVAAPFRQAEFDIEYGHGISAEGCLLDLGLEHNLVQKSGSFFSYGDERIGQGRNNAKAYLRENPATAKETEQKIYEATGAVPANGAAVIPVGETGSGENGAGDPKAAA